MLEISQVFFVSLEPPGFTSWSAERSPEDVFTLLESTYQSFDTLAKRKGVFKVETVSVELRVTPCRSEVAHELFLLCICDFKRRLETFTYVSLVYQVTTAEKLYRRESR